MALRVRATVVDLRNDDPSNRDFFLVDTNVWLWAGYSKPSLSGTATQVHEYPAYLWKVLTAKGTLFRCGLSLAETSHLIEKFEHGLFQKTTAQIGLKEYRQDWPGERSNVLSEIKATWAVAVNLSENLDFTLTDVDCSDAIGVLSAAELDGYDAFMANLVRVTGLTGIVTDDADFITVPGITVFTANRSALEAARKAGSLATR